MVEFIIVISLLVVIILLLLFFMVKLSKKVEYYEDWILSFKRRMNISYENIKQVDNMGVFESDDDVGTSFKAIVEIIQELNSFITINEDYTQEETTYEEKANNA